MGAVITLVRDKGKDWEFFRDSDGEGWCSYQLKYKYKIFFPDYVDSKIWIGRKVPAGWSRANELIGARELHFPLGGVFYFEKGSK